MTKTQVRREHLRIYVRDQETLEKFLQKGKAALRQAWRQAHPDLEQIAYTSNFLFDPTCKVNVLTTDQEGRTKIDRCLGLSSFPEETRGKPSEQKKIMYHIVEAYRNGEFGGRLTYNNMVKVVKIQFEKSGDSFTPSDDAIRNYAKLYKLKLIPPAEIEYDNVLWLMKHFPQELKVIVGNHVINPLRERWEREVDTSEEIKQELVDYFSGWHESVGPEALEEEREAFMEDLWEQHQEEFIEQVVLIIDTARNPSSREQKILTTKVHELLGIQENRYILEAFEKLGEHVA